MHQLERIYVSFYSKSQVICNYPSYKEIICNLPLYSLNIARSLFLAGGGLVARRSLINSEGYCTIQSACATNLSEVLLRH